MTSATLLLLGLVALPAAPAGELEVLSDVTSVTPLHWSRDCGDPPTFPRLPQGTRMRLVETGQEWSLVIGGEAVFGTNVCSGINPTLAPTTQRQEGQEWFLACRSRRVVKATEETETYLRRKAKGRVEIESSSQRYLHKNQQDCRVVLERKMILQPLSDDDDDEAPAALDDTPPLEDLPEGGLDEPAPAGAPPGPAAPEAAPRPLSAGEQAQIESEINKALKTVPSGAVRIVHDNQMSGDYQVVERRYILDGKPLGEDEGARWKGLKAGAMSEVLDDAVPVGVHVLEVDFLYLADSGRMKLRVKDAVFFDVTAEQPVRVKVIGTERGNWFTPTENRPVLRFEINDKPYQR